MFEDSLMESRGCFASKSRRWITVGSVGLQCLIAGTMVLVPILRPEALPFRGLAPVVIVPVLKRPPVVVEHRQEVATRSSSVALPSAMAATRVAVLPSMRPIDLGPDPGVSVPSNLMGMALAGGGGGLPGDVGSAGPRVTVATPKKQETTRVSAGVSAGLLLGKIQPVYPRIAVAARVEGIVVIEATISKSGTIESARVVSGPAMLAGAAIDAVRAARYRPYLLNGEATEVQTTVTVNFRLGS
jgi:protein TonB